jgi:hypothetical protein
VGNVPSGSGYWQDAKNAAFRIRVKIANGFDGIQPGSLSAEDPEFKSVGGFEHHKGTDEDGGGLNLGRPGDGLLGIHIRDVKRDNKTRVGVCA